VPNFVIWGSGYPSPYRTGDEEVSDAQSGNWSPTSLDFQAAAQMSGTPLAAANLDDVLAQIGKQKPGAIERLGIVSHALEGEGIGLSGYFTREGDNLTTHISRQTIIDIATLQNRQSDINQVRDRFAKRAFITLFACTTGLEADYLVAWDQSFGVECRGFKGPTTACMEFRGEDRNWGGVIVVMNYRVVKRGSHSYKPTLPPNRKPCDFKVNSLWLLKTDSTSRRP
jgi:hypothetical protein